MRLLLLIAWVRPWRPIRRPHPGSVSPWRLVAATLLLFLAAVARGDEPLRVGFGERDITPELREDRPVWIAGYGHGRRATGVHDPLLARCVVLRHGERKLAWVSVDLIGLQYAETQRIRARLSDYEYVLVTSTHNHEAPDVIGIWGRTPLTRGVDDDYLALVVERVVEAVRAAEQPLVEATAAFGTAENEELLRDSRRPVVRDGVLRTLVFRRAADKKLAGLVVQWNCHPESLGSRNTLLTADFPWATVAALAQRYGCPVVYVTGAVGGLMAPPGRLQVEGGKTLEDGQFDFAQAYGERVAELATQAVDAAVPLALAPWTIAARPLAVPLENPMYGAARSLGVLKRAGRTWTGDPEKLGEVIAPLEKPVGRTAVETEVAYLRLGDLHVAAIPGEIYPELVYGRFEDPAEPHVDFPDARLEKPVREILPGDKWMLFGLANDEIGYIIPKRQWDQEPPFAYGRPKSQYGEINSCGPEVAPFMMQALENRVREATQMHRGGLRP